jgi:hypothetical protein
LAQLVLVQQGLPRVLGLQGQLLEQELLGLRQPKV